MGSWTGRMMGWGVHDFWEGGPGAQALFFSFLCFLKILPAKKIIFGPRLGSTWGRPSISHLFGFCVHAKEVWSSCKLSFPFDFQPSWDFMDVIWLLQKCEESQPGILERTVMVCWGIWKNRNEVSRGASDGVDWQWQGAPLACWRNSR